jgi:hypothetical protein
VLALSSNQVSSNRSAVTKKIKGFDDITEGSNGGSQQHVRSDGSVAQLKMKRMSF